MKNQQSNIVAIDINTVKSRMLQVRGQQVLLDRDVAALYGVETRITSIRRLRTILKSSRQDMSRNFLQMSLRLCDQNF